MSKCMETIRNNCELRTLYSIWMNMCKRVNGTFTNPHNKKIYAHVKMCKEWHHCFAAFAVWAVRQPTWQIGKSIDRINNNGGYFPNNCRFATAKEQANNRRNNHKICICGIEKNVSQWVEICDVDYFTFSRRITKYKIHPLLALILLPNKPGQKIKYVRPKLNGEAVRALAELDIHIMPMENGYRACRYVGNGEFVITEGCFK